MERSGRFSVIHLAPSTPPVSSSGTAMTFSVPPNLAPRAGQAGRGDGLGGRLVLHVDRAAAVQEAVADLGAPRVGAPVLRVGEHGVDVAQVAEARPVAAAQRRDQARALRLGAGQLDGQPRVLQVAREPLQARPLVAGRIDRLEADQAGQDLGGLVLQLLSEPHLKERSGEARDRARDQHRERRDARAGARPRRPRAPPTATWCRSSRGAGPRRRGSRPPRPARRRRGTRGRSGSSAAGRSGGRRARMNTKLGANATAVATSAGPSPPAA